MATSSTPVPLASGTKLIPGTLTTSGAFLYFAVALGASVWMLLVADEPSFVVLVPLIAYGLLLVAAQRFYVLSYSSTIKDSPYFLGFTLTMVGLVKIFTTLEAETAQAGAVAAGAIAGQAGHAILATVIGLFARQALWSYERAESVAESRLMQMSDSLAMNAHRFAQRQEDLVALIGNFVESHQQLWEREQEALTRYLEQLDAGGRLLSKLEHEYPERISALTDSVGRSAELLASSAELASVRLLRTGESFAAEYSRRAEFIMQSMERASSAAASSSEDMSRTLEAACGAIAGRATAMRGELEELAAAAHACPGAIAGTADSLRQAGERVENLDRNLRMLAESLCSGDRAARDFARGLETDRQVIHEEIASRSQVVRDDLRQIDQILDEFVELMRRHVAQGRLA
ncbi:MAG TPA: hypothetical protein VMM18_05455 [Gemmatimonadaceae bacterium]|nr:hypothetical protein [Gemmatimonadaceae bacterium]